MIVIIIIFLSLFSLFFFFAHFAHRIFFFFCMITESLVSTFAVFFQSLLLFVFRVGGARCLEKAATATCGAKRGRAATRCWQKRKKKKKKSVPLFFFFFNF